MDGLLKLGVDQFGFIEFDRLIKEEMGNVLCKMHGIRPGDNITTLLIKSFQKVPTQQHLDSFHITKSESLPDNNREEEKNYQRDSNLYLQLTDFVDLIRPRDSVIMKFFESQETFCIPYKKTQTSSLPWLKFWMDNYSTFNVEFCTDIHNYLRLFGPLCSLTNLSNLLNRIESEHINYTIILLSIAVFPENDISPISRNSIPEKEEVLKSIMYEDLRRKISRIDSSVDRLVYSRTRNMFNLPALQGTNYNNNNSDKS